MEFTVTQREMLGMVREGAESAKASFDRLDDKAQALMAVGGLILALVGITSSAAGHPVRDVLLVVSAAAFVALVLCATWARRLRDVSDAPMKMDTAEWPEWEPLEGRELWAQMMVQYMAVFTGHKKANVDKSRFVGYAQWALTVELVCIAAAVLIPWA